MKYTAKWQKQQLTQLVTIQREVNSLVCQNQTGYNLLDGRQKNTNNIQDESVVTRRLFGIKNHWHYFLQRQESDCHTQCFDTVDTVNVDAWRVGGVSERITELIKRRNGNPLTYQQQYLFRFWIQKTLSSGRRLSWPLCRDILTTDGSTPTALNQKVISNTD